MPIIPSDFASEVGLAVWIYAVYAVLFLVLWMLFIRPASKRNRAMRQEQQSAQVGSDVMLTSGIFGTVASVDEDAAKIGVEIAPGIVIHVARVAIATVVPPKSEDDADEAAATDETADND